MLPAIASFSPPALPPPPLETLAKTTLDEQQQQQQHQGADPPSRSGDGASPSLLVIAAIVVFVIVVSATIHLLLRFFSRRQSSSSASGSSSPLALLRRASSSLSPAGAAATPRAAPSPHPGREDEEKDLIESLPLFTLSAAITALPKSSLDCAVCLYSFHPHDQLRLLPSCRHAFHATCIDPWLRSSLSCPLCRSPIVQEPPPLPPPPAPQLQPREESAPPPPAPQLQPRVATITTTPAAETTAAGYDRSGSFRVEIGSVSRRRTPEEVVPELPPHARSYSLGSSFQYVVEEEVEAVVAAVAAHVRQQRRKEDDKDSSAPAPPGEEVAEEAGGRGSRSWLRDYVDRLASSASSSFSSLRFSGCGSRRMDGGVVASFSGSWDLESGQQRRRGGEEEPEEDDAGAYYYYSFYRWLMGA